MIFVSHDLATVSRFCDRALYLEHGVAHALGPTDDVIGLYLQNAAAVPA